MDRHRMSNLFQELAAIDVRIVFAENHRHSLARDGAANANWEG